MFVLYNSTDIESTCSYNVFPADRQAWVVELPDGTDLSIYSVVGNNLIIDQVKAWANVRSKRNDLLTDTDWIFASDTQASNTCKTQFTTYRQELRDIPQNYANALLVVWPTKPTYVKK